MQRIRRPDLMKGSSRLGLSVFELLVIIAILGFFIGLLLPAVSKVREAAARTSSLSKMRQLGIAVHNHQDNHGTFPRGIDDHNFSALVHVLPFIEETPLYESIDLKKDLTDKANAKARKTSIKLLLSPQDPRANVTDEFGATNYLFSAGSKPSLTDNDGPFHKDVVAKIPDSFGDGASRTIIIGETLKGDSGAKAQDVRRQHVILDKTDPKNLKDESGVGDFKNDKNIAGDRCASWMDGRFLQGTTTFTRGFNDARPDVNCDGLGGLAGLRSYQRFALVTFADASTRPIMKADLKLWKALASMNGKEETGTDF